MARKLKQSKRYALPKLAIDWREKIFDSLHSEHLKLAIAVLTASGCRPSELERGVAVSVKEGELTLGIQGSKVDEITRRGQPLRVLFLDSKTPWGAFLQQKIIDNAGQPMLVKYDAGGISQRLREKSREIWPRRSALISAYCYRHFIGKSMKESGMPVDKIASTLGHASDYSQMVYGRRGGGKKSAGQHGIQNAIAAIPIRHSIKTDRSKQFQSTQHSKTSV
jgi:integrase